MSMIPTHAELEELSDEELVRRYDAEAAKTEVGTGFYRDELARRTQQRQASEMLAFTRQVRNMTGLITVLTIINVVFIVSAVWR